MTEFQTNYDQTTVKDKLNNFKSEVETNWFNYLNQYNSSKFNDVNKFKKYLQTPDPNEYKSYLRDEIIIGENKFDSEVEDAWLPLGNNVQRDYYIPKPVFKGNLNSKDVKEKKIFEILNDFYRGFTNKFKKVLDKNGSEIKMEIFQVPQLVQKLKYLVIKKREELFQQALQNHVIIFSGGTGTGKSTQLPQYFLEFGFAQYGLIACTQPRKLAVTSIQKSVSKMLGDWDYTASEDGEPHFNLVGKKYKGTDEKGKVIQFISEGSLLTIYNSEVKKNPNYAFDEYSVIMIDEAHMRSVDIDRLLAIVKTKVIPIRQKDKNKPFLLVVMSATANLPTFEKYFGGIKAIVVEGTQKPVDIRFQKEPVTDYVMKSVEITKEIHTNPDSHVSYLCETTSGETGNKNGFILVFLNTGSEIATAVDAINNNPVVDANGNYVYAYGLASDTLKSEKALIDNLDDKDKLIEVLKNDAEKKYKKDNNYPWDQTKIDKITRAVIFATNVAEASVTIDNLSYCIDSGLEYKMLYNPTNDLTIGAILPTSKANVLQRKGRVGRKQVGNYYPLFTNEINPVKQPIDQFKELNCAIPGKKREQNIEEIKNKFDNIFRKLIQLENNQYNMSDLIDNLIKYIPLYEYNIYTKLNQLKLIKDDIDNLSLIGKKEDTLNTTIDGVKVLCRLNENIFINDIKTPITNLPGYPKDNKEKQTFIIGLFNNPTVEFINYKNIFAGEYPWNQNNLEYCIDILEKITELLDLNDQITFNDVKNISKDDIKRVKNIGKLKGKITISEIKRILTKKLPKINEDTEPEILSSELSNFLLEIFNLQPTKMGSDGKQRFGFNVLSKIINNEGLIINPRTENLQNAINKLIKSGIIEIADPFGNELRIKSDPDLSKIINLPTTFENKMMLYKTLKNNNLKSVFISSIYLSCIIDYLKQQKGQSGRFITSLLRINEKTELIKDIIAEDDIYIPGNIIFTVLLFILKYLPIIKQNIINFFNYLKIDTTKDSVFNFSEDDVDRINGIIKNGGYDLNKISIDYKIEFTKSEEFKKKNIFYLAVSEGFSPDENIREDKIRVFFDIMRFAIESIKTLFVETNGTGFEFIDDKYLKTPKLNSGEPMPAQIYPSNKAEMEEFIQRLQYSVLEGYHSELCIRESENYLHSTSGLTFKYKPILESERILPKYLVQFESSLKDKGYLMTLACSIEPSIYEIFKKHFDTVKYTIIDKVASKPDLTIPTTIKGGKMKKSRSYTSNNISNAFDPIIYF